jgi:hypothetical protein
MRLFGLGALLCLQDSPWLEQCRGLTLPKAESLRSELADLKEQTGLARAVRAILLYATLPGAKGEAMLKELSAHVEKVGAKPDPLAGLKMALGSSGDESFWLALGYLEMLIAAGQSPAKLAEEAKKIKVKTFDGGLATEEGSILATIKKSSDAAEIERSVGRAGSPELSYTAAIRLLKLNEFEKAGRLLSQLKKWSTDHVDFLLETLKQFKPCSACRGSRQVVCQACKGTKKREIVCPECGGEGSIKWDPNTPKTPLREQNDRALRLPKDKSYCPSCLNRADVKKKIADCTLCEMKGVVTCQKCRWQKVSLEAIGKMEPCAPCAGTGSHFAKVFHPCGFCKGLGEFLIPLAAPEKRVGPAQ